LSRYPNESVMMFDQQFAETFYERQERQRKDREKARLNKQKEVEKN